MELNELEESSLSKWVANDIAEKRFANVKTPIGQYNEEAFTNALRKWEDRPNKLEKKIKIMVRLGIPPNLRAVLWKSGSGGAKKQQDHPRYYQETITDMGIQIPSLLPECMFSSQKSHPNFYYLNPSGKRKLLEMLYILTQIHPDMQFCPLLPPTAALFLHMMEEDDCYCCLVSMLDSNTSYFDQSQREVAVMAKTFQDCLKSIMKSVYIQLKLFVAASREIEVTKGTVLFPHWLIWLFKYLDFWTLVYTMDNFMLQGPKVLVRVGLVLFKRYSKWLTSKQIKSGDMQALFSQFVHELPLRGYRLLEAAFKIRGLSKKKLSNLKAKNSQLLNDGILEVPFESEAVKIRTLYTLQGSDILSASQWEKLAFWLSDKIQIRHPFCLFSTENDGYSIQTLYNKCETEAETVLLIKTSKGEGLDFIAAALISTGIGSLLVVIFKVSWHSSPPCFIRSHLPLGCYLYFESDVSNIEKSIIKILGAYCSSSWSERSNGQKSLAYFGTGETFVFSLHPTPVKYSWSGLDKDELEVNEYFMAGDNKCLMIGAGGGNALWLDAELSHGHSCPSKTFGNKPLSSEKDFDCVRVEVLGFKS